MEVKLVYVSLEGIKIFTVDCSDAFDVVKELEEKARQFYKALKDDKLPEAVDGWECKYCEFKDVCDKLEVEG